MGKTAIWIVPYILSWFIHLTWPLWSTWLTKKLLKIQKKWKLHLFVFCAWIVIVSISSGCPFTYLHQWIEVQAGWREQIRYKYEDCLVYKLIINPITTQTTERI